MMLCLHANSNARQSNDAGEDFSIHPRTQPLHFASVTITGRDSECQDDQLRCAVTTTARRLAYVLTVGTLLRVAAVHTRVDGPTPLPCTTIPVWHLGARVRAGAQFGHAMAKAARANGRAGGAGTDAHARMYIRSCSSCVEARASVLGSVWARESCLSLPAPLIECMHACARAAHVLRCRDRQLRDRQRRGRRSGLDTAHQRHGHIVRRHRRGRIQN